MANYINAVSISLPNIPEAVYLFYAISKIGAIANRIDPRTSSDGIADYLNETRSSKLFVIDLIVKKIDEIKQKTVLQSVITVSPANSMPVHLRALMKVKSFISGVDNPIIEWNKFMKAAVAQTSEKIDEEEFRELEGRVNG